MVCTTRTSTKKGDDWVGVGVSDRCRGTTKSNWYRKYERLYLKGGGRKKKSESERERRKRQ